MGRYYKFVEDYYVDKEGNVYSKRKFLKMTKLKTFSWMGYQKVKIENKTLSVHRIIAKVFLNNPKNKETINHKNGDKSDNRVVNLEWATRSENTKHAYKNGLKVGYKGNKKSRAGITKIIANEWMGLNALGMSLTKIGKMFGFSHHTIKNNITKLKGGWI